MKSTFINMILVLGVITLVASAAVGMVYRMTKEPIAQAKTEKKTAALTQVLPEFDNDPAAEMLTVNADGLNVNVYPATKGGETVAYAVESITNSGFSGTIKIMVGFEPSGKIINIEVLEQNETPGLGAKLVDADNPVKVSFIGKTPADMKLSVKKDGGDVDAITASTVSSRAYVDAVRRAYNALGVMGVTGSIDSASGATSQAAEPADTSSGATSTADTASGATDIDSSSGATPVDSSSN